jgi:hypothetical protein
MCCSKLEHITEEAERCWIRFADELQRLHGLSDDSHTKLLALLAERNALQASAGCTERALTATPTLVDETQAPRWLA